MIQIGKLWKLNKHDFDIHPEDIIFNKHPEDVFNGIYKRWMCKNCTYIIRSSLNTIEIFNSYYNYLNILVPCDEYLIKNIIE